MRVLFLLMFLMIICDHVSASMKINLTQNINYFSIEDGLPEISIRCIKEDRFGVLWLCTAAGLVRYDGYDFEVVMSDVKGNDISSYNIRDIHVLESSILIATENGLYSLDLLTGIIYRIDKNIQEIHLIQSIRSFEEKIYISSDNGLFLLENNQLVPIIENYYIRDFTSVGDKYYISVINKGILTYDIKSGVISTNNGVFNEALTTEIEQIDGKLFFSTYGNGLIITDKKLNILKHLQECEFVDCLPSSYTSSTIKKDSNYWIATRNGLVVLNENHQVIDITKFSDVIDSPYITNALQAFHINDDYIWFGLHPGGLIRHKNNIIGVDYALMNHKETSGSNQSIYSILRFNDKIYVGTYIGLYDFDIQNNKLTKFNPQLELANSLRIQHMCSPNSFSVALGTSSGMYVAYPENKSIQKIETITQRVESMSCDSDGVLYTVGKNIYFLNSKLELVKTFNLTDDFLQVNHILLNNNELVLSTDRGVYIYNVSDQLTLVKKKEMLTKEYVKKTIVDNDKIIVITKKNIYSLNDNIVTEDIYKLPSSLKHLKFFSGELIDGDIWVTSNNGILQISSANYFHYIKAHGLGDIEFNSLSTTYDSEKGVLYAGGLRGLTHIKPVDFKNVKWPDNELISKVEILSREGVVNKTIFGRPNAISISEGESIKIELGHLDSIIRAKANFYYTVISNSATSRISLKTNERRISFVNIANEDFTFSLSNSKYAIQIDVKPYIWKRWWALTVYLIVIMVLLVLGFMHLKKVRITKEREIQANRELDVKRKQLASMSHELRTPLNSIIGILDGSSSLAQDGEYIRSSAYLLRSLIDNALSSIAVDVYKKISVTREVFNIKELVDDCNRIISPYLDSNNLKLEININEKYFIYSDRVKLQQVILNLLKNAIKHAEGLSKIIIRSYEKSDRIYIEVEDDGVGILHKSANEIFNMFTKLDDKSGGFGIGLNISKRICNELDGDLTLDSTYLNGARFIIELKTNSKLPMFNKTTVNIEESSYANVSILILEDDPLNSHALKLLLNKVGVINYKIVSSSAEIYECKFKKYDVIILDLNFGENINGIDLAKNLRADDYVNKIYILSSESNHMIKQKSLNYVNEYLVKPISVSELKRIMT